MGWTSSPDGLGKIHVMTLEVKLSAMCAIWRPGRVDHSILEKKSERVKGGWSYVRLVSACGLWYYKCKTLGFYYQRDTISWLVHSSKLSKLLQFTIIRHLIKSDYFSGSIICHITQNFHLKSNQAHSKCLTSTLSASLSGFKKFLYNISSTIFH
jgi:hypothetical protein